MAIPMNATSAVSTLIMPPCCCILITQLETPVTGSGIGCCATSHLITGKSKFISSNFRVEVIPQQYVLIFLSGAPENISSIVSRLVTAEYWQRQCGLWFPEVNGYTYASANPNVTVDSVNKHTQGWNLDNTTRLIWTNG